MKKREKDNKEITSIIESFVTAIVICGCLTMLAAGIAITANNSEHLSTGAQQTEIYTSADSDMISVSIDKSVYETKVPNNFSLSLILSVAPAPISSVYWLYENISQLISSVS